MEVLTWTRRLYRFQKPENFWAFRGIRRTWVCGPGKFHRFVLVSATLSPGRHWNACLASSRWGRLMNSDVITSKSLAWLDINVGDVPEALKSTPRWVCWRAEHRPGGETKIPYRPGGGRASVTDPSTWSSFGAALAAYRRGGFTGVGFVLTEGDDIAGVDLDHCREAETGAIAEWAQEIVDALDSYAEISPSGTGIRVFVRATLPPGGRRREKFEMYDSGRYLTVTGRRLPGTAATIEERSDAIARLHARIFGHTRVVTMQSASDDDALIRRAKAAANGAKFSKLWEGDTIGYSSQSEADLALCSLLAFWTDGDTARADRLFRRSGLMRAKWDERHGSETYGAMTIARAMQSAQLTQSRNGHRASEPGEDASWPERQSLPSAVTVPTLPAAMVPEPLRPWLVDIAERLCIPIEMAAAPALVAVAAVVGRSVGTRPERFDDFTVVPNLWGGVVAPPGWLKSPAIKQALAPLSRLAALAQARYEADALSTEATRDQLEAQIAAVKADLAKRAKAGHDLGDATQTLADLKRELRDCEAHERRYMTQDATTEKLGELLKANPRGLLLLRDELAGFLATLDKPGREGDREFYLESWAGDQGFTVDRIARGTLHIPALTLSVFGGIQPGKLKSYIDDAQAGGAGADGLLQRLQVLVWPDALGEWQRVERWPESGSKRRSFDIFEYLDTLDPAAIGAEQAEENEIPYLRFDHPAQALFNDWRDELERRLRTNELEATPAFASHLAKYRSLMPSLALLFHLVSVAAGEPPGPVSFDATRLAAAWCDFLEAHARKVYATELNPGQDAARALVEKIAAGAVCDGDSIREISRHHWAGLSTSAAVDAALSVLAGLGWVRVEIVPTDGRPGEIVRFHPELRRCDGD